MAKRIPRAAGRRAQGAYICAFLHSNFGFVSDFDIRISDFLSFGFRISPHGRSDCPLTISCRAA
jgi:hypothetical protein